MYVKNISPQEAVNRINLWQSTPFVHQLTCAKGSTHELLAPVLEADMEVALECPTCGHRQYIIPEVVLRVTPEQLETFKQQLIQSGFNF